MNENDIEIVDILISEDGEESTESIETLQVIEIDDVAPLTIETDNAFAALGEPNEKLNHALLNNRDIEDQHPITAITGLRAELDDIESLKTVYSDKINTANYYKWHDATGIPIDSDGLFVTCVEADDIRVCNSTDDIFGVTVSEAGFVGGQDDVARDNAYGLVVCSGVVAVRCELDVAIGDSVVSNSFGYAQKADSGYGYKVIGIQEIKGVIYAIIPLGISVNQVNAMMTELDTFDDRLGKAEINIVSAINVANAAHNKAGEADRVSAEALKEALDALLKADNANENVENMGEILSGIGQTSEQAKAIAESAVSEAERIRGTAEKMANDALAGVNNLIAELEPITTWTYTDETGTVHEGAEYFTTYIKNDVATKAEVLTVETLYEENKSMIEKNAEGIQSIVSSVDKYSVGEYSQAYGLSQTQARSILTKGMVYIPTKHVNTPSHSETYSDTGEVNNFTPNYYYIWDGNDWIESSAPLVAFFSEEPFPSRRLEYWYIDADTAPEGYEPHALYIWKDEQWTKVNILEGNVTNRIVSTVRQTANEVALEVTNARGSAANLGARIGKTESNVTVLANWQSELNNSMATINLTANDIGSSIAQVVQNVGDDGEVTAASIVTAINNQTGDSIIKLSADVVDIDAGNLSLKGQTIQISANEVLGISSPYFSVSTDGKMTATGGQIGSWTIAADEIYNGSSGISASAKYTKSSLVSYGTSPVRFYCGNGDHVNGNFVVLDDGSLYASAAKIEGHIEATSGTIGGCEIENNVLNIENAEVGNLFANYATIDYLQSEYITADYLHSNYIDAGTLEVSYATAERLEAIEVKIDSLTVDSFSVDGKFYASVSDNNVQIGGFNVDSGSLYYDKGSMSDYSDGVYIGTDGISVGPTSEYGDPSEASGFYATSNGEVFMANGTIVNCTITNCTLENLTASHLETNVYGNTISTGSGYFTLSQNLSGIGYTSNIYSIGFDSTNNSSGYTYSSAWNSRGNAYLMGIDSNYISFSQTSGGYLFGTWYDNSDPGIASDLNKKHDINNMSALYDTFFDLLHPITYKYNDGTSNRSHTGFIAQEVEQAVLDSGLTTQDFAGFIRATEINDETGESEETCYLRYGEFVSLNTWQIQKLKARVSELEDQIALLVALS